MGRPSGWDVVGLRGDPTPGDVHGVRLLTTGYRDLAEDAESAARTLRSVKTSTQDSGLWFGMAAATFVEQIGDLPEMLDKCADSYREVVAALGSWRVDMDTHQASADRGLASAKEAAEDVASRQTTADSAAAAFDDADVSWRKAVALVDKWEGKVPPPDVKVPSDARVTELLRLRREARAASRDADADLGEAEGRLEAATKLVAEAKVDYEDAAERAATSISAARAKAVPKDSFWKRLTSSEAWKIFITIVTVILVVALVVAVVLSGAGAAIAMAVAAVAGAILTADDVAQFMAGNMSGAEFAMAMVLTFVPGGKAGKAITAGLKRAVAPLAKAAGALGDLRKVTGPVMARLADGLRRAAAGLDSQFARVRRVMADDAGEIRIPFGRGDDVADAARKSADDAPAAADALVDRFMRPRVMADEEYAALLKRRDDEILDRLTTPDPAVQKLVDDFQHQPWDPPMRDGRIAVEGTDKTISVEDYVRVRYASTWNADATTTVLGKFSSGTSMSYIERAEIEGARHFNLGGHWEQIKKELGGLDDTQMFELFNKPFLEEVATRTDVKDIKFVFSHDPGSELYKHSALAGEMELLESCDFRFGKQSDTMVYEPSGGPTS